MDFLLWYVFDSLIDNLYFKHKYNIDIFSYCNQELCKVFHIIQFPTALMPCVWI